jgi:HAD superfamily hydrolase (TIGR01490 family)
MRAAVFSDVEGTLVDGSIPRMVLQIGRRAGLYSRWQVAEVGALALGAKLLPDRLRRPMQALMFTRSTGGYSDDEVQGLIDELIPTVRPLIKPAVLQRLRDHQQAGLPLVLVSGGLHEAIARLGAELGGRGEGTKLQRRAGRYLARLEGPVCQGEGKAMRARAIIAEMGYDPASCYAYGDTASDIPFLSLFGHPCAVDPDSGLAAEAQRRGWPVLRSAI